MDTQRRWEKNKNICMKIIFWGNERKCGLTLNMLLLTEYLVWHKGYRITIFELVREDRGVKFYLSGSYNRYHKSYIETMIEKQLYYVSGERWKKEQKKRKRRRGKHVVQSVWDGICYIEKNMDFIFVNLADREDEEARKMMREADLLIVNIKQSQSAFDTFFMKYANLSEHIFFLIGSYFAKGSCDKVYLCNKYRIAEEAVGVIPFHSKLAYICEKGKLDDYIRCSRKSEIDGLQTIFIRELEQIAEKMISIVL